MIINLTPAEEKKVAVLRERMNLFVKNFDIPTAKLDTIGLVAREQFFEDCSQLVEIYQLHFAKLRRQQTSKKGKKYLEAVLKKGREAY